MSGLTVPTAARPLRRNHLLRAGDVVEGLPAAALPAGTLGASDLVVGRYLTRDKAAGEVFVAGDVSAAPVLAYQEARLVSIGLPAHRALGGLLEPGLRVDLYGTIKASGGTTAPEQIAHDVPLVAVLKNEASVEAPLTLILGLPAGADAAVRVEGICTKLVGATDLFVVASGPL